MRALFVILMAVACVCFCVPSVEAGDHGNGGQLRRRGNFQNFSAPGRHHGHHHNNGGQFRQRYYVPRFAPPAIIIAPSAPFYAEQFDAGCSEQYGSGCAQGFAYGSQRQSFTDGYGRQFFLGADGQWHRANNRGGFRYR